MLIKFSSGNYFCLDYKHLSKGNLFCVPVSVYERGNDMDLLNDLFIHQPLLGITLRIEASME